MSGRRSGKTGGRKVPTAAKPGRGVVGQGRRLPVLLGVLAAGLIALAATAPYRARVARETAAMRRQRLDAARLQAEVEGRSVERSRREERLRAELAAQPEDPAVRLRVGLEYLELGAAEPAVRALEPAVRARPEDAETRAALGQAYEAARRLDRALDEYRAARRLVPGEPAHDLRLASLLSRLGWRREAFRILNSALIRQPRHAGIRIGLALLQFQTGDLRAAEAQLLRARALEPENAAVFGLLADVYTTSGRFTEACTAIESALRLRPDEPDFRALRAVIEQATGNPDAAERDARAALALHPTHGRALDTLARVLRARGKTAEALAVLEPLLDAPDADEGTLLTAAQLARQLGRRDRADDLARRHARRQAGRREIERLSYRAELFPTDADLRLRLGRAYQASGDAARAVVELRRALELRPGWEPARSELARARAASGG